MYMFLYKYLYINASLHRHLQILDIHVHICICLYLYILIYLCIYVNHHQEVLRIRVEAILFISATFWTFLVFLSSIILGPEKKILGMYISIYVCMYMYVCFP
jgi:hypothetical protein